MVYFLFDNPADKQNMEFLKDYSTASFNLIFPSEQCKSVKEMIRACYKCIQESDAGDTIICWYDFMGILCWWLCEVLHKKRNIVALNILLKKKKTLKNNVARFLYRQALKSANLNATVTSKEYGRFVNELLNIKKKYVLIHDIYHGHYDIGYRGEVKENSVFCGGRNGRDWDFLFQLIGKMPDIQFNVVVPKGQFEQYWNHGRNNVSIETEITEKNFLELMCQSSLVILPLNTEAPAGLIVMFQAAGNGKLIISTDTVTTKEYLATNRGVLCKHSFDEWESQTRFWLAHKKEAQESALNFRKFLENECSEQKFAETLLLLVNQDYERLETSGKICM